MNDIAATGQDSSGHATTAVLRWAHWRGGTAQCLVQMRGAFSGGSAPDTMAVVASELRDNPRGLELISDVPGWAGAVLAQVVPRSVTPENVRWWVRHGWYSTFDPAGPETLTELELGWDGHVFVDDLHRHRLLPPEEAQELAARWRLEPVDVALAALGQPAPRRFRADGGSDLAARPLPRRRIAASMLLTDPAGAMLVVEPT